MRTVAGLITTNYATEALGNLTRERTVASLPFGGRYRLVDFQLSNMVNSGITTVGVITPYKYRSIIDHLGNGKLWGLDRKSGGLFILPGSVFGISSADSRFILRDMERNKAFLVRSPAEYIVVSSANMVCRFDYNELVDAHEASGADMTLVYKTADEDDADLNSLKFAGERIIGTGKGVKKGAPAFLDCFVTNRELLLNMLKWYKAINHLDIFDILQADYEKMDVRGYEFKGYSAGIFTTNQYFARSMDLLKRPVREELFTADMPIMTKGHDNVPAKYTESARVRDSIIQAGCVIGGTVEKSILFRGVTVEPGAVVKNSIIFYDCHIRAGSYIENTIIDRANTIGPDTVLKGTAAQPLIINKKDY